MEVVEISLMSALIMLAHFIYWFIKNDQRKTTNRNILNSMKKQTTLLDTLEKKRNCGKGEVKGIIVRLTDIARNYIEEAIEIQQWKALHLN
jgi:hypothetical protein